jgi:hypothetical protein
LKSDRLGPGTLEYIFLICSSMYSCTVPTYIQHIFINVGTYIYVSMLNFYCFLSEQIQLLSVKNSIVWSIIKVSVQCSAVLHTGFCFTNSLLWLRRHALRPAYWLQQSTKQSMLCIEIYNLEVEFNRGK